MIGWLHDIALRLRGVGPLPKSLYCPEPGDPTEPVMLSFEELEPFSGPLEALPSDRREVYEMFGDPGADKPSRPWQSQHMIVARDLPGRWNGRRGRLYVNRLAEPYLREALRRCELAGELDSIDRLGCYAYRRQRHDKTRPLSYHSWGIAIDVNPTLNRPHRFRSRTSGPWSRHWRSIWPGGVSQGLVGAFESTGWSWGGRWDNWRDPMHFELISRS